MQRRASKSHWVDYVWEPWSVLTSDEKSGAPRRLVEAEGIAQWLHAGFTLVLHRDEIEGYYLNVSAPRPRVFVLWRMENDAALPIDVTLSSEEAARWADGGHSVDGVPIPADIFAWVGEHVEANYRPKPEKRFKPRSFQHPKDRA